MTLGTTLRELRKNEDTINAGTKWSEEENNKFIKEISDNKSYEEIALEHKRTILAIHIRVISHIIYPKYKEDIENGNEVDIEKISLEYKIDSDLIRRKLNSLNKTDKPKTDKTTKPDIFTYIREMNNKINDIDSKIDILLKIFGK